MKNTECEQPPIERRNQTKIQRCLSTLQLLIIVFISNFMSENTMTNMKNRMEEANIIIGGDGIVYLANYRWNNWKTTTTEGVILYKHIPYT